jgi:ketol-acid reductoisomerase
MNLPKIYTENDANIDLIKEKNIGIIGFGNQARAQALNLKDSGINVTIGLRKKSKSRSVVTGKGFACCDIEELVKECDFICILIPDQEMEKVYHSSIEPYLKEGDTLLFSHGYNIYYKLISPPKCVNVILSAPSGAGSELRNKYKEGKGIPGLIAVDCDFSKKSFNLVLSYSMAIGLTRFGVFETSFKEETETDLFGEQVILAGGLPKLIQTAYSVLIDSGYSPISSWLVCYYELKTIVDMFHSKGFEYMGKSISDTAEYGALTRGGRVISDNVKNEMKTILKEIQNKSFHNEWIIESEASSFLLKKLRSNQSNHEIDNITKKILDEK